MSPRIARECPRFNTCSVNNCPLDPHPNHSADQQTKCKMEKSVRQRIAAKYHGQLANGGLTAREAAGARIYASLPYAVKSHLAKTGKDNVARFNSSNTPNFA
jgi:hypothetical protein